VESRTIDELETLWSTNDADDETVGAGAVVVSDVSDIHIAEALSGFGPSWEGSPTRPVRELATTPNVGPSSIVSARERIEGEESPATEQPTPGEPVPADPSSGRVELEPADVFAPSSNGLPATTGDQETDAGEETYVSWGEPDPVPLAPVLASPATDSTPSANEADEVPDAWGSTMPVGEEAFFGKRSGRRRGGG
jgi:hypothetical protein